MLLFHLFMRLYMVREKYTRTPLFIPGLVRRPFLSSATGIPRTCSLTKWPVPEIWVRFLPATLKATTLVRFAQRVK